MEGRCCVFPVDKAKMGVEAMPRPGGDVLGDGGQRTETMFGVRVGMQFGGLFSEVGRVSSAPTLLRHPRGVPGEAQTCQRRAATSRCSPCKQLQRLDFLQEIVPAAGLILAPSRSTRTLPQSPVSYCPSPAKAQLRGPKTLLLLEDFSFVLPGWRDGPPVPQGGGHSPGAPNFCFAMVFLGDLGHPWTEAMSLPCAAG